MAADNFKFTVNATTGELDVVQNVETIVEGPAASTDNAIARFDSTSGKLLKDSSVLVNDDGTVTLGADGVTSLQAVTKQQLDAAIDGVQRKSPVRAATTANIALTGTQTIDGISLIAGDRVLVKDQTAQSENGIYEVAAGAWSRTSDADTGAELTHAIVSVEAGTANGDRGFEQQTDNPNVGVDNIVWFQTYGVGTYTADGEGIELNGATFSLELDGSSLSKSASGLRLAALTANRATETDASGNLIASAITNTELAALSGISSNIQTQLNGKANTSLSNLSSVDFNTNLSTTGEFQLISSDGVNSIVVGRNASGAGLHGVGSTDNLVLGAVGNANLASSTASVFIASAALTDITVGTDFTLTATNLATLSSALLTLNGTAGINLNSTGTAINISTGGATGDITLDAQSVDVSNSQIKQVSDPTAALDAANKRYVDIASVTAIGADVALGANTYNLVDTSAARTLTLPAASLGALVSIKDSTGSAKTNIITVNTPGAETIDGAASLILDSEFEFAKLVSDGTNWFRV